MDTTSFVPRVGSLVYFGRTHGEKTLGQVVKVNRARCKVEQLEARGTLKDHRVGLVWTVPFSLLTPAPETTQAHSAASPASSEATLRAEVARLRQENEALKALGALGARPSARHPDLIKRDILNTYCALSTENLTCDGELPRAQVRARAATLNRTLQDLFREFGRTVTEEEAYASQP